MGVEQMPKEDLDLQNHLIGLQQIYIKLSFLTSGDLLKVTPLLYFTWRVAVCCGSKRPIDNPRFILSFQLPKLLIPRFFDERKCDEKE